MGQLSTRSIRTFVLRQGRLTEGQQRSLDLHWDTYGVEPQERCIDDDQSNESSQRIDFDAQFDRQAPVWMEIGFGNGAALAYMAERNQQINFLGVEVHLPGVGHALGELAANDLKNVRLVRYDVLDLMEHFMLPGSIDRLLVYFPDPWHKTRHHKRRLINATFLDLASVLLRGDGLIHFASDWVPYARQVQSVVADHQQFECLSDAERLSQITDLRPKTHFERRGDRLGHQVTDLVIRKLDG